MQNSEKFKRNRIASANLRFAVKLLPESLEKTLLDQFNEHLGNEQIELALNEIIAIGLRASCPGGFWRNLERAAQSLDLQGHAMQCRVQFNLALDDQASNGG